jgi:cysteamine dioxygenase
MLLQRIFSQCVRSFPSPRQVDASSLRDLEALVAKVTPAELGIAPQLPAESTKYMHILRRRIPTMATIIQSPHAELAVFFVPKNEAIPLHDHPGMHVFSKVLFGKVHMLSYDWADSSHVGSFQVVCRLRLWQMTHRIHQVVKE